MVKRTHKRVLFFGVLDYPPNAEAVHFLGQHIAPQVPQGVEILVAGRGGEDLAALYPGLSFQGFVEDIHALVRSCDGVVVPILAGGGTRMKILESVACGTPVVSTTCGAEGIELWALGDSITIADEAEQMVAWIENLEVGSRCTLPDEFQELYDWATIWQNRAPL